MSKFCFCICLIYTNPNNLILGQPSMLCKHFHKLTDHFEKLIVKLDKNAFHLELKIYKSVSGSYH